MKQSADTLSLRALNRALLSRQWLLERADRTVPEALEHLVGMQAQAPLPPYFGLWTRLARFRPDDLAQLIRDRRAVRLALMRSTIHLVTDRDGLALRGVLQPMLERGLYAASPFGKRLAGMDLEALVGAGRAILDEAPLTMAALGARLHERWPDRDGEALAQGIRALVPLVQVPPRGVWGESGQATCATAETWLGRPLDTKGTLDALVLRYLAAFGPASTRDVQAWSGLTGVREVMARLRAQLRVFHDPEGRELFDVPEGLRPSEDVEAPPRFIPAYDNLLLAHADRTRVLPTDVWRRILQTNGQVLPALLIDGFASGTWELVTERDRATLRVDPFARLGRAVRAGVMDEGAKLLAFAVPGRRHEVVVGAPTARG